MASLIKIHESQAGSVVDKIQTIIVFICWQLMA